MKEENEIDLGYRFMENEWGKGFATEAAKAVLYWGFTERNIEKIIGRTHIDNIASQMVLQKIGMQFESIKKEDGAEIKIYTIKRRNFNS